VAGGAAGTGIPLRYTFRLPTDPARLDASRLDALVADLRRLDTVYPTTDVVAANGGTTNRSGLLALVEAHATRWRSAEVVLSVAVLGTMAIALHALALVALLAARRRRPSLDLARGRGASTTQAFATVLAEGVVLTVPAAVAGGIAAALLVPSGSVPLAAALAGGVAAIATALLIVTLVPATAGPPPDPTRETGVVRRTGARRLVAEGVVVIVALAGAYALRERGVAGVGAAGGPATVDPFVALVPALVGIAAGIVVVRLFPFPVRVLARVAAARRGLVPAYALRRLGRESSSGLILAVLMATATIATFCSVVLVTLDRAADATAWHDLGAPYRITALASGSTGMKAGIPIALPADFDPTTLPGVVATAEGSLASVPYFPRGARLDLLAIDTTAYADLAAGTPVGMSFPPDLLTAPEDLVAGAPARTRLGSNAAPVPVIVSTLLAEGVEKLTPGKTFQVIAGGRPLTLRVVEVRDDVPTMTPGGRFAVVDLAQLRAAASDDAVRSTVAFVRAPDDAAGAIRTAAAAVSPDLVVASRAEAAAETRTTPLMEAVVAGLTLAALVAALYAALAVTCALALSASARAVEVAHLRTLGLSRRQSVWLVVAEHGPTVAVAFVVGVVLGVGLFAAVGPALGTDAIVGSAVAVPLSVEPLHLAGILVAVVAIVAVGMAVAAAIQRRAVPALAVRRRMA
jgi:putative ABC transport system permease protein